MTFYLKCKNCGNVITINTNDYAKTYTCVCGEGLYDDEVERFRRIESLDGFNLIGVEESHNDYVLNSDLTQIKVLYSSANKETQRLILSLIDYWYLIISKHNVDEIKSHANKAKNIWSELVELRNAGFGEILGIPEDE